MEKSEHDSQSTFELPSISQLWRIESLLIAITPLIGAIVHVVYQMGYLGYYGVPFTEIEIDLAGILLSWLAILPVALGFSVFLVIDPSELPLMKFANKRKHNVWASFILSHAAIVLIYVFYLGTAQHEELRHRNLPFAIQASGGCFLVLLSWAFYFRHKTGVTYAEICWYWFLSRLSAPKWKEAYQSKRDALLIRKNSRLDSICDKLLSATIWVIVVVYFSYTLGAIVASGKKNVLVLKDSPNQIFLQTKGEFMICLTVEGDGVVHSNGFTYRRIEKEPTELQWKRFEEILPPISLQTPDESAKDSKE